jgi:putative salt-induced outer membrane protein YdiY
MRTLLIVVALAVISLPSVFADQITLTNGDRLTGTIIKSDDKELTLKTDYAGELKIDWTAVQGLTSAEPLHIRTKAGQTLVGPVASSDGNLTVTTASGSIQAPKNDIVNIRSAAEETAYEKSLHPGLLQGWNGGTNVGFALTRGNSQTKNLALAFTATRATLHDKLGLYANSVYAANDAPGAVPSTTANAVQSGIRYDRDFAPRVFAFVVADFQTDSLQGLNLRSVPGAGLGYHAIKNEKTTLDLLAGIDYTRESYTAFTRNFVAASLGEELMHKWGAATVVAQKLEFFPNLQSAGEYRGNFVFGTVTKLSKWLGWQNSFGDIYVSNPPLGKKKNDVMLTTGLNISFTH